MKENPAISNGKSDPCGGDHILNLRDYHVCSETGFMLKDPLERLPEHFDPWNDLASSLPALVRDKKVREAVDKLPLLDHELLVGYRQKRLAHLQLCFIIAGYLWQDGDAGVVKVLPRCLAIPFFRISEKLGVQPVLGHVDLVLANWCVIDTNRPRQFDNLKCIYHLPGDWAGEWFCIVTQMVEFSFAKGLEPLLTILDELYTLNDDHSDRNVTAASARIANLLHEVQAVIEQMQASLARMHDHLSAKTFFNVLRPFLAGWGGHGSALPEGLIYEGISDKPIQMPGGSAAQSTTLQVLDSILGVQHVQDKKDFLVHMRNFMPPDHKRFIEDLENWPYKLRDFVLLNNNEALGHAYNRCVEALVNLRNYHIQIVTKYIVVASKESNEGNYGSLDAKGTGGTSLIPFLKDLRTDTEDRLIFTKTKEGEKQNGHREKQNGHRGKLLSSLLITGAAVLPIVIGVLFLHSRSR